MAWTYSDYDQQATAQGRYERLRLHVQEVTNKIDADLAADGMSRSSATLMQLRARLKAEMREYEVSLGLGAHAGFDRRSYVDRR